MRNIHHEKILILDFGSQYTQLIARRIREIGVYCELCPYDISIQSIIDFNPKGIILSGGPDTVIGEQTPRPASEIFELDCPVLGICYGMQLMAAHFGGEIQSASHREFGHCEIQIKDSSKLFDNIEDHSDKVGYPMLEVWMSHSDRVTKLTDQFKCIAKSKNSPIAAFAHKKRPLYGLQFHPEVTHTLQGNRILKNFVSRICQCQPYWQSSNIIDDIIVNAKQRVGQDNVILGLSGGVDSAVVAALLSKAIGKQLTCIFVDSGLLRTNEAKQVITTFNKHFGIRIIQVDAKGQFYTKLKGIIDPERKRSIIGNLFIDIFAKEAKKLKSVGWLAQGTIYPDIIESAKAGTQKATIIKTHHNVGGLPERMPFKLIEPLRELFKDEVRQLGLELGLPYDLVYRHPFPGPGLAVRILGEVKPEYVDILQQADSIFIEELHNNDLYYKVSQAFVVFLPVCSVGVVGDVRQYEYVVALRAVETIDFMTARWAQLPYSFLAKVANRIVNEVKKISRVTYDISNKPPATIEWE